MLNNLTFEEGTKDRHTFYTSWLTYVNEGNPWKVWA